MKNPKNMIPKKDNAEKVKKFRDWLNAFKDLPREEKLTAFKTARKAKK